MKIYSLILLALLFFSGCKEKEKEEITDRSILIPQVQLTPLQKTIDSAIVTIVKKDIELNGETVNDIHIDGREIIKISKKEYYTQELNGQQVNFENYLQYLKRFANTKKGFNDIHTVEESKRKHDAVMTWLKKSIANSSTNQEVFKVVYYVKAATKNLKYQQQQTTFLDKDFKKIVSDYSFLRK
ncbi:MAG: hypothetical protein JNM14_14370 [Ferruginibacter sp.]|nr:hypothetical protein [Ferruginibacter sp.]